MQSRTLNIPSWVLWSIIALALIGFTDSAFLLAKRLSGAPIPCFITSGCDTVSKSPYSVINIDLGSIHKRIPLAGLGVLFYLAIGFLALLYIDTKNLLVGKLIVVATTLGFLSSAYFIYVQKFKIGAFCIYCILSAITSVALFAFSISFIYALRGNMRVAKLIFIPFAIGYILSVCYFLFMFGFL